MFRFSENSRDSLHENDPRLENDSWFANDSWRTNENIILLLVVTFEASILLFGSLSFEKITNACCIQCGSRVCVIKSSLINFKCFIKNLELFHNIYDCFIKISTVS